MAERQKRILVVEDERPMAKALEMKLTHEGFAAESVLNGEDAVSLLEKQPFDLVLLDLVMPKLDGFKVMERMQPAKINVPVIILSNLSQEEDAKRAKALGAREFFVKSDTPISKIVEHVKEILK